MSDDLQDQGRASNLDQICSMNDFPEIAQILYGNMEALYDLSPKHSPAPASFAGQLKAVTEPDAPNSMRMGWKQERGDE